MPWRLWWVLMLLRISLGRCFNHWVVTEDGKIEYQVASPFNLRQPFDLMAFIQQEKHVSILKELKEELVDYKNEFESLSEYDSFDESYRAGDPECRKVSVISSYDLYISTVLPLKHKGINFLDHLIPLHNPPPAKPYCTLTPLEFSMSAMEHLEGVQSRRALVGPPEKSVLKSIDMRMEMFGSLVHYALEENATSWVLLNLATLYWRARGNPHNAIECIRRALHYSPYHDMDISLLNLANILHRAHHSEEAALVLGVAISLAPSVSVLHFTLGNVYAALNQLNKSVNSFKRCVDLDPSCDMSQKMYYAALCEQRMDEASKERTEKLDSTQKKLDMFYNNMEMIKRQQAEPDETELFSQRKPKKKKATRSEFGNSVDATPVLDPNLSSKDSDELESKSKLDLEQALDHVLSGMELKTGRESHSDNSSGEADGEVKRTRSNFRLVLKPLPPPIEPISLEFPSSNKRGPKSSPPKADQCPNDALWPFQPPSWSSDRCNSGHGEEEEDEMWMAATGCTAVAEKEDCRGNQCKVGQKVRGSDPRTTGSGTLDFKSYDEELTVFDHIERDSPPPGSHVSRHLPNRGGSKFTRHKEYPLDYHNLEFLPYNPLPDQLESVIFPKRHSPLPLYHDPYWPRKKECLDLVKDLKGNPQLVSYTGTFITPEARGASIDDYFSSIPAELPPELRKRPDCTETMDLPHSMAAMDHLEPIMYRNNFSINPQLGEGGLRKVLVTLVTGRADLDLTFEDSAERVYASMIQNGPDWVLFNLASLYWRVRGDPTNSIECLRRAVHSAPWGARDVGYIGLSNVLLRLGYLNEAVIMARAALDISENSPIAHYTLAHIYLGLRDYVAASLHLRAALHAQPVFSYALTSLKMVRCSLKFKEEQMFLRQKMKEEEKALMQKQEEEIIKSLKEAMKSGKKIEKRSQPAIVIENKEPPEIPELSMGDVVESPYIREDALWYLVRLSLSNKDRDDDGGMEREVGSDGGDEVGGEGEEEGGENGEMEGGDEGEVGGGDEGEVGGGDEGEVGGADEGEVEKSEQVNKKKIELSSDGDESVTNQDCKDVEDKENSPLPETVDASKEHSPKQATRRTHKKPKRQWSKPSSIRSSAEIKAIYEEIERETRELLKEAAEALNRNQTPVMREAPAKIFRMPPPDRSNLLTKRNRRRVTSLKDKTMTPPKYKVDRTTPISHQTTPSIETHTLSEEKTEGLSINPQPTFVDETTPTETAGHLSINPQATPIDETTPTENLEQDRTLLLNPETTPIKDENTPTKTSIEYDELRPQVTPTQRPTLPKVRKTREEVREEEIQKRFPGTRPWPMEEECNEKPLPKTVVFTSTWLSVTAKGAKVKEHIDFKTPVSHHIQLPYCHNDFEQSKKTLSHLTGMNHHPLVQYRAEKGLQEVLCTLDGLRRPLDEMASRIKMAMDKNSTSWVLSNLAALYWRIVGQGQLAIRCLKHALYYSDENSREVALVSLSNVLYRSGYDIDAAVVIHMSLESSPTLVVNHFTMANILAAQGLNVEAAGFYESTLHFQPEFQPAADRLKTVRCLILAARNHKKLVEKKEDLG